MKKMMLSKKKIFLAILLLSVINTAYAADTTPPTQPLGVTAIASISSAGVPTISLSWQPSTDNVGVTGYNIYRSADDLTFGQLATVTGNSYSDIGLTIGTTYYYYIIAFDAVGNPSIPSDTVFATVGGDCPTSLSASSGTINNFVPSQSITGNVVTYSVNTTNQPGVSIKELCVYPNPGWTAPKGTGGLAVLYSGWKEDRPSNTKYFGFMGTSITMSADGNIHSVGSADYSLSGGLPSDEKYLLHVLDSSRTLCGSEAGCWMTPGVLNAPPQLIADSGGPYSGTKGISLVFDASKSIGDITLYSWDFGDGQTGSGVNPSHIYAQDGTYTVKLTVSDSYGNTSSNSTTAVITPLIPQLVANPDGPYSGTEGNSINFDGSKSTGSISGYTWNFGDGYTAIGINASHIYTHNGTYTVKLTVSDSYGNTSSNSTTAVITDINPIASFVADPITGQAPLKVNFTDTSVSYDGIATWKWDFNNDNIVESTSQNPTYTYTQNGTYTVKLQVCDKDGACSSTATKTITVTSSPPGDTQPPSQPLCPVAIVLGPTSIYLNWQASTDNVGVVGYKIYRGTDNKNLYYLTTVQNLGYTDQGLTTGVTYYYSIVAIDAAGNPSIGSDVVYATPRDITPPTLTVPKDMVVEATSPKGAAVSFTVTATDDYDPNPVINCNPASGSTFPLGYTTVTCTATDVSGNVGSAIFTIRVVDTIPPTAPTLTATVASSSEIDLSWIASYDAVGVTSYVIYRSDDGSNFTIISTVKGTTFNNIGLWAGKKYFYYIKAYDNAGNPSVSSNIANAITLPPPPPGTPGPTPTGGPGPSPSPTDTSTPPPPPSQDNPPVITVPGNMIVEATAPNGAVVTFNVTAYDYEDAQSKTVTCYPPSGSRFPIGTTMVSCTAKDNNGNVGYAVFSIRVQDTTPPTPPSSLSGIALDSTSIGLGWNPSTDAVGVVGYYIYRSQDGINFVIIARTSGTSFTNTGLIANATYYYYVRAYDAALNPSGQSIVINVQTLPETPSPPGTPTPTTPAPTGTPPGNPCSSSPNTPVGQNVLASPIPSIDVKFDAVLQCGQTTAVAYYNNDWTALPSTYSSVNYYDIGTTATYSNSIMVQIYYSSADIPIGVDPNTLRFFHYQNGNWVDVTSALDTSAGIITGTVNSLSPFAIGGLPFGSTPGPTSTPIPPGGPGNPLSLDRAGPSSSLISIIILGLCLLSISILRLRRRL